MSTLEKLKQKLNLSGAGKGFDDISKSASKVDFSGIASGASVLQTRFSAMQVVGVTALANIANSAVNAGKQIYKSLTVEPILTGFKEYETQIGSIQTILANTQSKGSNLQQVNAALNELNKYADKTIYNFTEMTRNIGTFTAAGVGLQTSVTSIKGIANLAAISGSTSAQASQAMYQLSQALAAGKVSLMDWNSVVNAGMGGEVFQNALKRTATQMGTNVDALIEKYGSFRESLTQGQWLTADVLTETLTQLSGAYSEADLIAKGYTEQQAKEIMQLAETGINAATKVKTFTQLWDTLKEAAQSGWTKTWEILVGDFDEAQDMLTGISDTMGNIINSTADARNNLLSEGLSTGWKQLLNQGIGDEVGFQNKIIETAKEHGVAVDELIKKNGSFKASLKEGWVTSDILRESIGKLADETKGLSQEELNAKGITKEQADALQNLNKRVQEGSIDLDKFANKIKMASGRENILAGFVNIFKSIGDVIKPIKDVFSDIFPSITGDQLYSLTEKFRSFTEHLKVSAETTDKIKSTFKGLFSILDIGKQALTAVLKPIANFLTGGATGSFANTLLSITAGIGNFFTKLNEGIKAGNGFAVISKGLSAGLSFISETLEAITGKIGGVDGAFSKLGSMAAKAVSTVSNALGDLFTKLRESVSLEDIFTVLAGGGVAAAGGGIFLMLKKFTPLIEKVKELMGGGILGLIFGNEEKGGALSSIKDSVVETLDAVGGSLKTFQNGIKAGSLVAISAAVVMLASALRTISGIDGVKVAGSLLAIGALMGGLTLTLNSMTKILSATNTKGMITSAVAMMGVAAAVNILASAMKKIGSLSLGEIAKGLTGVYGALLGLNLFMNKTKFGNSSLKSAIMTLAVAKSVQMIGESLAQISKMSWSEIARGLTGAAGAMGILSIVMKVMDKVSGSLKNSVAIMVLAKTLDDIASALKDFALLSWYDIGRGLTAMGGALAELTASLTILGRFSGGKAILGAASILIATQALEGISTALITLGSLSWDTIGRGLTAMAGALGELSVVSGVLGKTTGISGLIGAGSIVLASKSLEEIATTLLTLGTMSWETIGKGLTAMGGALTELGVVSGVLGKLTGMSGLMGAASILVASKSLEEIAEFLIKMSTMSWEGVAKGLAAMGGALSELGIVTGALGKLSGFSGLLGAGSLVIGVKSLKQLADAFADFGAMSWGEIGRGLVGMGGALTELGVVSAALGKLGGLSSLLGAGSLTLAVQGLGKLADAFYEIGSMSWSEIGRGLVGMGGALTELGLVTGALGKLAGFAGLIGAGTLLVAVQGLDDLAQALQKFGSMSWDEVTNGLTAMGVALGETALGGLLNTLSIIGAGTIAIIAKPLGDLADSVNKWKDVTIPEGLGVKLGILGKGIESFTFGGFGAGAIATVAEPIGTLADSISKWKDVTIPETLGTQLTSLADGVKAFTLGGWGADAVSTVASPLGTLADSVKKWTGVSVPENLGTQLTSLANGVKAFTFGGWGADTISTTAGPLGTLADSIKKWTGVTVPENLGSQLTSLANGVKAFTFGGFGADALATMAGPIGTLADSISKWKDIVIPENLGTQIASLSKGIMSFTLGGFGSEALATMAGPIGTLATSVNKWSTVTVPEDLGDKLSMLAKGIKEFTFGGWGADNIVTLAGPLGTLATSASKWATVTVPEDLGSKLSSLATGVSAFTFGGASGETISAIAGPLGTLADSVSKWATVTVPENLGSQLTVFATGIKQFANIGASAESLSALVGPLGSLPGSISQWSNISFPEDLGGKIDLFKQNLSKLATVNIDEIVSKFSSGTSQVTSAIQGFANAISSTLQSSLSASASKLSSVGTNMVNQLASGLTSGQGRVTSAVNSITSAMVSALNSKKSQFTSIGSDMSRNLVNGIKQNAGAANAAVGSLASGAASAARAYYGSFSAAGSYVASGFAAGITAGTFAAAAAASAMASAAMSAAKSQLGIHSPSRVFRAIGGYVGEGFAQGIDQGTSQVVRSTEGMANGAMDGARRALSRVADVIDSDIDSQPTIRPVVDLSDVSAGANAISSLLGGDTYMGAMANVGVIGTMTRKLQNGANDDVISAINDLQKSIAKSGDTNIINGITYSNGTDVADAIKVLVRAAKIEGRV